ncbi:MAG TPA: hypothetical protein VHO01_09270 [Jatrophihabitans sp.]|nr:hypothetical protein [Jatrophihabitans sp.]
MASRARTGFVALVVVALAVAAIAVGARALWHAAQSAVHSDGCDFGDYSLDLGQAQIASTVVGVVLTRKLPERAAVLTLGAALQESKLRNLGPGEGDRDSVGILQQRPSQGWGTAAQIANVQYATGKFLDAVVKVPHWQSDSLATVVQTVQVSADGSAYAKHEAEAQQIADALTGATPMGVSCSFGKPTVTAGTATVAQDLTANLPVAAPRTTATEVSVPGAGWATAGWLICNADDLGIDAVHYAGHSWTRGKGWQPDEHAASTAVVATMAKI